MHRSGESISMILKNIMEKLKTVIFFGLSAVTGRSILFHAIMRKTVQYFIVSNYCVYSKVDLTPIESPEEDLMNYSFGIVSVTYAVTSWDILDGQAGKYIGKDKKWHPGKYLFTVDFAHPESNILDTDHSEVPHEHKCAHIIALDDGNYAAQPNNRCILGYTFIYSER